MIDWNNSLKILKKLINKNFKKIKWIKLITQK